MYYDYYESAIEPAEREHTRMQGLGIGPGAEQQSRGEPGYQEFHTGEASPPAKPPWYASLTPSNVESFLKPFTEASQVYTAFRTEPYKQQLALTMQKRELLRQQAELAAQRAGKAGISSMTWVMIAVAGVAIVGGAYWFSKRK